MIDKQIPGTVMPYTAVAGGMFSQFRPMIRATDGLSLGQVCAITGLEISTVQNWVKRGFVAHPVKKKYYERHLARILLISALRDCMQIDRIGELLTLVNGDTDDESDDIISEEQLYDYLCETVREMDGHGVAPEETTRLIERVTADYSAPDGSARRRLTLALLVMVCAYVSGKLKQEADLYFRQITAGGV